MTLLLKIESRMKVNRNLGKNKFISEVDTFRFSIISNIQNITSKT